MTFLFSLPTPPPALVRAAAAEICAPAIRDHLLAAPRSSDDVVRLSCSVSLQPGDHVRRRILLEGKNASGVTIDCNGAVIGRTEPLPAFGDFAIEVRSAATLPVGREPRWERPEDVTIKDCAILGQIRIWGMGLSGQGSALKASSHNLGHTERAQAAAPTRINILHSQLMALGYAPLYIAPGVTSFTLRDSEVIGRSISAALYLDAESAENVIAGNRFDIETGREVIAVDGSARNRIEGNRFALHGEGAIRLYRNCGEGGTVRHQTPSYNILRGNIFSGVGLFSAKPIVVNSRGGWRIYCGEDAGYPFGSSLDNGDNGIGNLLKDNRTE